MELEKRGAQQHTKIRETLRTARDKVQDQQRVLTVHIREEEELSSENRKEGRLSFISF